MSRVQRQSAPICTKDRGDMHGGGHGQGAEVDREAGVKGSPAACRSHAIEGSSAEAGYLRIDPPTVRRAARAHGPRTPLVMLWLRQKYYEWMMRIWKHIRFRHARNPAVCAAYEAMALNEFAAINALQCWANWRNIPRLLNGRMPNRPLRVLDLCSGTGQSTVALAYYCPSQSVILGLEHNARFVEAARARHFVTQNGHAARVAFGVQNVLEPFCNETGVPLPAASFDLIHSTGAIGCHFDAHATAQLAPECARVLRPGGLLAFDTGRAGTTRAQLLRIFEPLGFCPAGAWKSCALDRHWQVAMRKNQNDQAPAGA